MIGDRQKMGKPDQIGENMPGLSPQTEASKLLEQALMQMDGIISGSGTLTAHSPEYGFPPNPPGVREAATQLATALQNTALPPPPDPSIAAVILSWIQQISLKKL
ncbi:uncharacterized protein LOC126739164 [Anthonomus grandis grandis]|uniref:uncharacterized protein LOC126739164 n=1 Tax=Anthonomus grandis grandis TaxID=2921223 RepID=UPI00216553CD|nr:uncharacterized protein LOC126739164 [Anthonomus grandis grandis]